MKIHEGKQGTVEWLQARAGMLTASELGELLTDKYALRKGDTPHTYLCKKLAERWTGFPLPSFSGGALEQGSILEEEALPWYEVLHGVDLHRTGFITTDDGLIGCSPDALVVGQSRGVEIKCPQPTNHVRWLLAGVCPPEHMLQVQGGMFVTGYPAWSFISYCRNFPHLEVLVQRDDEAQEAIARAVAEFAERMRGAMAAVVLKNGGRLPTRTEPFHYDAGDDDSDPVTAGTNKNRRTQETSNEY